MPTPTVFELISHASAKLPAAIQDRVVVFGSAPLVLAGLRSAAHDLDLFASPETFEALRKAGFTVFEEKPGIPAVRVADNVNVYNTWPGVDFWDVYTHASPSPGSCGLKVASLRHVLAYKIARSEPKDANDVEVLRDRLTSVPSGFWASPHAKDVLDAWYKYQQISMHFNDLLSRLRTQAVAGLAAVATATAFFNKDIPVDVRTGAVRGVFGGLLVLWVSIALIDQLYYQPLISGAVDAILRLEKSTGGALDISCSIARRFAGRGRFRLGPIAFYAVISVALGLATIYTPSLTSSLPSSEAVAPVRADL